MNIRFFSSYMNLDGVPVERNKIDYPYSYDPYVQWESDDNKEWDSSVYSDRLMQWDFNKFNTCCQQVFGDEGQYFSNREPKKIEQFLSLYFEYPIKLIIIQEGCNVSNGYPYWIFHFKNLNNDKLNVS